MAPGSAKASQVEQPDGDLEALERAFGFEPERRDPE